MRYLGIDYGSRWIGLALADTQVDVVLPLAAFENKKQEKLFNDLLTIINEEKIDEIIIGVPINLNSSESKQTNETREFISAFNKFIQKPVHEEDERLTSQGAAKLSVNSFNRETKMHSNAALLILETYLQRLGKSI